VVAGPRELDLAGHDGRQRKGKKGGVARLRPWVLFISRRAPGRGYWRLGEVDLVWGDSTASGRSEQAASCMAWRLGSAPRTRVSVGRCQGAGQVALESSPGSTWPWTRRGRGPPAAYGGRRAKQSSREGRDGGQGLSVIFKSSGTSR
jgi:hypothetical protein